MNLRGPVLPEESILALDNWFWGWILTKVLPECDGVAPIGRAYDPGNGILRPMWHPNKTQWLVIWIAVLGGLYAAGLTSNNGLNGFVTFGIAVLIGGLLVWQLEGKRRSPTPKSIFCGRMWCCNQPRVATLPEVRH